MEQIFELSQFYGFKIIEDASHALGSSVGDIATGSCKFSDITVFSFHPVKMITTGEGGAALTNNSKLKTRIDLLRSHGVTRLNSDLVEKSRPQYYYEQQHLGLNFRITEIQCALGLSQMSKLTDFVERRQTIANKYLEVLEKTL